MRDKLKAIVEQSGTPAGFAFAMSVQALIVLSLVTFSIETLPNLSPATRRILWWVEAATVGLFTLEFLLRLWVADRPSQYAFSFFGMVDLAAILPFYLASGFDLRAIRSFRLLRLFRLIKLARYSKAVRRFHRALILAREELVLFFCVASILLYLSAVGIYFFENEAQPKAFASVFHSLWWAVCTLTTVGYGDVYPITVGGRIFTFAVLAVGLGVVAVPAGIVASALSAARDTDRKV
ncbi:MAG: ion transporter [Planctomycetales bacterium]|nr:ion transporter [Planctomycetales bacterium]